MPRVTTSCLHQVGFYCFFFNGTLAELGRCLGGLQEAVDALNDKPYMCLECENQKIERRRVAVERARQKRLDSGRSTGIKYGQSG